MIRVSSAIIRQPPDVKVEKRFSSACSSGSVRSKCSVNSRRYSIKFNRRCEVDESLFGKNGQMRNNNSYSNEEMNVIKRRPDISKPCELNKPNIPVMVIGQENVRKLKVINPSDNERSLTINQNHYQRLLNYQKPFQYFKQEDKTEMMKSFKRKEEMLRYDTIRRQNENLSDIEKENQEKAEKILNNAWDKRFEEEHEIRVIDEMIRNAKIQSIREHQVAEKYVIKHEKLEEDRKLNEIMEKARLKAIEQQAAKERKQLENEYLAVISMAKQRDDINKQRLMELEQQANETYDANQVYSKLIDDNKASEQIAVAKQLKVREEFRIAYEQSQERKKMEKIEEELLNKKVVEIQKEKDEKQRIAEELSIEKQLLRNREYARMRALQTRVLDMQSQRDELLERRSVETAQRKWRQEELEESMKRKKVEEELMVARIKQSQNQLINKVLEAKRDEMDFYENLKYDKALIEKQKSDIAAQKSKKQVFAAEIAHQIEQNKKQRLVDNYRRALEEEATLKESWLKKTKLDEIKFKKLDELRLAGISERFLTPIRNHIENPIFRYS